MLDFTSRLSHMAGAFVSPESAPPLNAPLAHSAHFLRFIFVSPVHPPKT